jgi:signal transduction histidine kinase
MMVRPQARPGRQLLGTLRQRLVASFVVLVGISLLVVGTYVYFQTERRLMQEVDSSLRAAASQALLSLEGDNGRLLLRGDGSAFSSSKAEAGFALRVLSINGEQWDGAGRAIIGLPSLPAAGYLTVDASGDNWRVLTEAVPGSGGQSLGWVQVARSLLPTEGLLETLRTQLYLVLPIALVLAAIAGYLLAGRTLRPLVRISQVADSIRPGDFGRRIRYQGPSDEIGKLAGAFDRMLDRVEQAFVRERRFTSDASHELRTPLTAIKGGLGVTLSRTRTPAEYERALQDLESQVDKLIRLSTGLLTVARAGRPRSEEPEDVDLSDLLGAIVAQVGSLAKKKEIELGTNVPPDLHVSGFAEDLARVFLNLLANAISFTPHSGRIQLSAQKGSLARAKSVRIDIVDTGVGVAADDLPHIFEPFYRGSGSRSREDGGSGLGLAIAREIVVAHGGSLDIVSAPGKGSTFTVRLPAVPDLASGGAAASGPARLGRRPRRLVGRNREEA